MICQASAADQINVYQPSNQVHPLNCIKPHTHERNINGVFHRRHFWETPSSLICSSMRIILFPQIMEADSPLSSCPKSPVKTCRECCRIRFEGTVFVSFEFWRWFATDPIWWTKLHIWLLMSNTSLQSTLHCTILLGSCVEYFLCINWWLWTWRQWRVCLHDLGKKYDSHRWID